MRYSIDRQELTDIADALRRKHGETELVTVTEAIPIADEVFHSNNMTDFGDFTGDALEGSSSSVYGKSITIENLDGASKVKYYISKMGFVIYKGSSSSGEQLLYMKSSDSVTPVEGEIIIDEPVFMIRATSGDHNKDNGFYAEIYLMDADGNYVSGTVDKEVTKEVKRTYTSDEMADAIDDIVSPPAEAFVLSDSCIYKFYGGGWDWFIENYGDKIKTENITNASYMFYNTTVESIPFELNFMQTITSISVGRMFASAIYLRSVPKINKCMPDSMDNFFDSCRNLRYLPEDIESYFDWSYMEKQTSVYACTRSATFQSCYSLRNIPMGFLAHANPKSSYSYSLFYNGFNGCYTLDEIVNLPIPYTATWSSNAFNYMVKDCTRLKNFTFATPDGQHYIMQWKGQIIDLMSLGYGNKNNILNYNSGITADKEVKDDATYQALKDDPDWFTTSIDYSRYNHDSAVATINSLPDTSAYLATAGGTNTIKFKGAAGSATDGGAINTLTEEEIAVATAKGWTVTLA